MSAAGQVLPPAHARACPECGGRTELDPRHGELVCGSCGLVVEEDLPQSPAADPAPPSLPIPYARVTGPGGAAAVRGRPGRRREAPRALLRARAHLNRMSDALRLPPHVAQDALNRVKRLHQAGRTQGRRLEAIAAAALLDAARDRGIPRTVREVAQAAGVKPADVGRAHRAMADELRTRVLPARPVRYLAALASRSGLPPMVVNEAARILQREAPPQATSGRRPEPLAAAAIVLAARRLEAQHSLARVAADAGVSRQAVYDALSALSASSHMNDFDRA